MQIFDEVEPEPSINTVNKMLEQHRGFNPDVIVGLGGGSAMDASKAFRIFFEHPDLTFEGESVSSVGHPKHLFGRSPRRP